MPYRWLLSPAARAARQRREAAAAARRAKIDAAIDRHRAELLEESDQAGRDQFAGGRAVGTRVYP